MSIGRPIEFDRDIALDAAMEVFWRQGFEATSMTDLLQAMQLSKSSLYQSFGGKRELFERCLLRYEDEFARGMNGQLQQTGSPRQFIFDTFDAIARTAQRSEGEKGCLISNSIIEFGRRDSELHALVQLRLQRFRKIFATAVSRAQAASEIPSTAEPAELANYLIVAMTGLRTLIKSGASRAAAQRMVPLIMKGLS